MKYSLEIYARAFAEILDHTTPANRDALVKQFVAVLIKNGDIRRAGDIVRAIRKILVAKSGGHTVLLEFARLAQSRAVVALSKRFSEKDYVESAVNPALVAGVRITIDGELQLDYSFARKLHKLFA